MTRERTLAAFLETLETALMAAAPDGSGERAATERAFEALRRPGAPAAVAPKQAPACRVLDDALETARRAPTADLGAAFAEIAPMLAWNPRPDRSTGDPNFPNAHANAAIIGDGGLEARDDVRVGVSLLVPDTLYPDHHHPPEEVYVALSPGAWRQNDGPWREPGQGGLVYNPPDIIHAMKSGDAPLLAIWTLPMAPND